MDVDEQGGLVPGYELKLNSYDLGVDIELYDAVQRLRFEHPEVRTVVLTSAKDKIFCAGANIRMLASSPHPWKVNFCKFTNETRNGIEDATAHSGQTYLAAVNGTAVRRRLRARARVRAHHAGRRPHRRPSRCPKCRCSRCFPGRAGSPASSTNGTCAATSPTTSPRRPRASAARRPCSGSSSTKRYRVRSGRTAVAERAAELAHRSHRPSDANGIDLPGLAKDRTDDAVDYRHVHADLDRDSGAVRITVRGPSTTPGKLDADFWTLAMTRELDDLILDLRTNETELGTWVLRTEGDAAAVLAHDQYLLDRADDWRANEIVHYLKRTLKRLDVTSRSLVALIEPGLVLRRLAARTRARPPTARSSSPGCSRTSTPTPRPRRSSSAR